MKEAREILLDKSGVKSVFGISTPSSQVIITDEKTGVQFIITPLSSGRRAQVECSQPIDWNKVEDYFTPLRSKFIPMKRRLIRRYKG